MVKMVKGVCLAEELEKATEGFNLGEGASPIEMVKGVLCLREC